MAKAKPAPIAEDLIALTKDGETIEVHRTCVADHKRLGWKEVPPAEEAAE